MRSASPEPFTLHGLEGWRVAAEDPSAPVVVVVHGSLDRADAFLRSARRVQTASVIAFDRRGYGASERLANAHGVEGGVADLLAVCDRFGARLVVGHSYGGVVALAAALEHAQRLDAVGAFEPPQPWRQPPGEDPAPPGPGPDVDPALAAEHFYQHIIGEEAWRRLGEAQRAAIRRDGEALLDDMRGVRSRRWLDGPAPAVPVAIGLGERSAERFRFYAKALAEAWNVAVFEEAERATHGAHLSAPDAFAAFIDQTVALGQGASVA